LPFFHDRGAPIEVDIVDYEFQHDMVVIRITSDYQKSRVAEPQIHQDLEGLIHGWKNGAEGEI
jgi:hypothetical protein